MRMAQIQIDEQTYSLDARTNAPSALSKALITLVINASRCFLDTRWRELVKVMERFKFEISLRTLMISDVPFDVEVPVICRSPLVLRNSPWKIDIGYFTVLYYGATCSDFFNHACSFTKSTISQNCLSLSGCGKSYLYVKHFSL